MWETRVQETSLGLRVSLYTATAPIFAVLPVEVTCRRLGTPHHGKTGFLLRDLL